MTDEYVEEATTFNGCEAPDGMRQDGFESFTNHYNRLSKANSLRWNGKWQDKKRETQINNHAIIDAIAGQLELTPYQKQRSHTLFDKLPTETIVGNQSSLLALCICGLVGADDGRDYHPNVVNPQSNVENTFVDLYEDMDVTYSQLYKCWNRVERVVL